MREIESVVMQVRNQQWVEDDLVQRSVGWPSGSSFWEHDGTI